MPVHLLSMFLTVGAHTIFWEISPPSGIDLNLTHGAVDIVAPIKCWSHKVTMNLRSKLSRFGRVNSIYRPNRSSWRPSRQHFDIMHTVDGGRVTILRYLAAVRQRQSTDALRLLINLLQDGDDRDSFEVGIWRSI